MPSIDAVRHVPTHALVRATNTGRLNYDYDMALATGVNAFQVHAIRGLLRKRRSVWACVLGEGHHTGENEDDGGDGEHGGGGRRDEGAPRTNLRFLADTRNILFVAIVWQIARRPCA